MDGSMAKKKPKKQKRKTREDVNQMAKRIVDESTR
jgi:hypothetical protein